MPLQMDTSKTGLEMFFKPYQVQALNHLQTTHPRGANTRQVHTAVNKTTQISRASIIKFLKEAADNGLLTYTTTTCKGGHRRIYKLAYPGERLTKHLIREMVTKLSREYSEEARKVLSGV